MAPFADPHTVENAAQTVNAALAGTPLSPGTRLELGLALIASGLAPLSPGNRGLALNRIVERLLGEDADLVDAGAESIQPRPQLPRCLRDLVAGPEAALTH